MKGSRESFGWMPSVPVGESVGDVSERKQLVVLAPTTDRLKALLACL